MLYQRAGGLKSIGVKVIRPSATMTRSLSTTPMLHQSPTSKPLYASNSSLPHLPVPSLSSTLNKYLETLQPLLSSTELQHSTQAVKQFLDSPLSSTLQARLEARASEQRSWLSDWWNETAYMGYRDRIVPFVNYFYIHKKGLGNGASQTRRAAELIIATKEFRDMVVEEVLEPEKVKGKPLDTESYKNMFGASRIPTRPIDTYTTYPPSQSTHVIVLRKNRFFKVDTQNRSVDEIEKALIEIKEKVGDQEGLVMGALTSENRDVWSDLREHLISLSPKNATSLQSIESSILLVCLDDITSPSSDRDARSWNVWCGGENEGKEGKGRNRWFDKHQLVVDEHGESGFNGEHSLLDGTPTLRLNEFILASVQAGKIPLTRSQSSSTPLTPEEITFITDETIESGIHTALSTFTSVMASHQLSTCHFEGYGKSLIKTHKVSPDAWVQMIKQLAWGKLKGQKAVVTYESAQTRKFALGRTEVIRSASKESGEWVEAMLSGKDDKTRSSLFRKAIARHIQYSTWAADGQGVDRHLFGLKKLLRKGEEVPELFKDEAFAKSSHWVLSTSQLSSDLLDGWGYGEVVSDGYGLSYSIGNDYIRWVITSTNGDVVKMKESLEWAAKEVKRMMESGSQDKARL